MRSAVLASLAELVAEAPTDAQLDLEHAAAARACQGPRCPGRLGYYHRCDRLEGHMGPCAQHQPSGAWKRWA